MKHQPAPFKIVNINHHHIKFDHRTTFNILITQIST